MVLAPLLSLMLAAADAGAPVRSAAAPPTCNDGFYSSLAHYPVNGTETYAEFDVPALPQNIGPTFFVYCEWSI
jgi:hypothetical protein